MFYFKVAKAYGDSSGRPVGDYPTFDDFEPNVDEFRIVGDLQSDPVGVTSIKVGDGNTPTATLQSILINHMDYSRILLS